MLAQANIRPRYTPSPCDVQTHTIPPLSSDSNAWTPIISCPADFPLELFESAVEQLVHHPEYNSTLILRSETIREISYPCDSDSDAVLVTDATTQSISIPELESHQAIRNIHRKLLPRRPGRDSALEQHCTLYVSTATDDSEFCGIPCTLVLTPLVPPGGSLPYYHPSVRHLAFRYIPSVSETEHGESRSSILRIEAVLLPNTPTDLNSRLYRTSLALLDTVHRYGWGALTHYQKRVKHDCLIPREEYQDLYLLIRERYKHLVLEWKEVTDPLKHVFEDIGIATYLMLLWKRSFASGKSDGHSILDGPPDPQVWSRPPGGFLDLGCGNGLLTHILISEGYIGHGIDLRARSSWDHYPEQTRAALHVHALDPTQPLHTSKDTISLTNANVNTSTYLHTGVFIIGNHADELTPWIPLLATTAHASGYLSIPCCAWSFDERFSRSSTAKFTFRFSYSDGNSDVETIADEAFIESLNLGGEGGAKSQYSTYRIWLASLSSWLGWKVECDTLRIPSTRNWAIVGRERLDQDKEAYIGRALDIIHNVMQRGTFKTRRPEGKAGDH